MVTYKNSFKIILPLLVVVALLAWIVMAVAGDTVKVVSPASGTNFTIINGTQLFNVTFVNGTDVALGLGANATFLFNISGVWTRIGNASCVVGANNNGTCAFNITNITIPDGVYSLNVTISNGTNNVNVSMGGNLTGPIYVDSTSPQVQAANFSATFFAGANLSSGARGGNYTINISVFDATIGIRTVYVNITNSSGGQNKTFTLTREGSMNQFVNPNLATAEFNDGEYNFTVYANDTLGNLNSSAVVQRVIFDKTLPTVTLSCTPIAVDQGDVVTCSCSASDTTSGVNTSYGTGGVIFTASPSTSQTGPSFTTSCSGMDTSGNIRSVSTTYAVNGASSSGSGSSGGSSGGSTGSGSTGSGSTGPANGSSTGSAGSGSGSGGSGQAQGSAGSEESSGGFTMGWIIAIIVIAAIVAGIIIMVKRKN